MLNLLSLPDELLYMIVENVFLVPELQCLDVDNMRTSFWADDTRLVLNNAHSRSNYLYSLIFVCRRFRNLLQPRLYCSPAIFLSSQRISGRKNRRQMLFQATVDTYPILKYKMNTVATLCELVEYILELFWLPRTTTLILDSLVDWISRGCYKYGESQFSNVENLQLLNCGLDRHKLTRLLSLPRRLTTFKYEVGFPPRWSDDWTAFLNHDLSSLTLALWIHKDSLESLVLTIADTNKVPNSMTFVEKLDLSRFKSLKTLVIAAMFLPNRCCWIRKEVITRLPPNLEDLRVIYDQREYLFFLEREFTWLISLLESKRWKLLSLRKVVVVGYGKSSGEVELLSICYRSPTELSILAKAVEVTVQVESYS
jgi:hypothetical protein